MRLHLSTTIGAVLALLLTSGVPAFAMRTIHNQYNSFGNKAATDPVKVQCGQQTGAHYDFNEHHWAGPSQVMAAWKHCIGRQ